MKRLVPALFVAGILALGAGRAAAATSDGTIITNMIRATYQGAGNAYGFIVTYGATATVLVQNPRIMLFKTANPTMQAPGGDVTFRVCVQNLSADVSAFNITVTDIIPAGFAFQLGGAFAASPGVWPNTWVITNSNSMAGPWGAGWPGAGQQPVWFMRWTLPILGQNKSGCVEFNARVL